MTWRSSASRTNSLSTGSLITPCTSTSAPARSASFASHKPVACTIRRAPSRCVSAAAARTVALSAVVSALGRTTYQTLMASAPRARLARTLARAAESVPM